MVVKSFAKVRRNAKRLREKLLKIYIGERCEIYKTEAEQLKINGKVREKKVFYARSI